VTPAPDDRLERESPQSIEDGDKRRQAALERARRADAEESPHPESKIEGAGMHEQPLQHILSSTHMRAPQAAGLVKMSARSLEQFAVSPEEAFPAVARIRRRFA
jgi:hypothetical protein